jgi:FkbM family methyltransferase
VLTEFVYRGERFGLHTVSANDHLARVFAATGTFYELDLLEYVRQFITCDLAVDVGANIGNHTVYLRRFVASHVVAVEPYQEVLPALHANVAPFDHVTVCETALGSREARGLVQMPGDGVANAGAGSIVEDDRGHVAITTFDALLDDWRRQHGPRRVGLIKMDVEGSELEVLRGAIRTLTEDKPDLLIEAATPAALHALKALLEPLRYTAVTQWAITPVYHFRHQPNLEFLIRARCYRLAYLAGRVLGRFTRARRA